ncbi:MAG: lysozyme inhibitor LprI family protein [Tissierellales bacterium]
MNRIFITLLLLLPVMASAEAVTDKVACEQAVTTYDTEVCSRKEVVAAEISLDKYLAAARERYQDAEPILTALEQAQQSWLIYRQDHCLATYALWVGGSIRGIMMNHCLRQQTLQRTWQVWSTYLTFMDSTPPLLPEPLQ